MTQQTNANKKWIIALVILGVFFLISLVLAGIAGLFVGGTGSSKSGSGNVAIIPVIGPILTTSDGDGFFSSDTASSSFIIQSIKDAEEDDSIKAIVLEINSPGGSAVASDEIGTAIKAVTKPTVAWIREVGASGGYWVASTTDHIIANRMTITGSIGVIGSYLEYPELLHRYNISYNRLVGGKYKDMGIPYRPLSEEESEIIQSKIDLIHRYFISEVAENRNISFNDTEAMATGVFYLGVEAKNLGLVDELGGESEVKAYLESHGIEDPEFVRYEQSYGLLDLLTSITQQGGLAVGEGLASALQPSMRIST